ncbi:MAG: peptide-methionine (S)-S-oxide reductase [Deltaproteobacteria bacterium]|nr:MAG: peptide-methionine (S)-S-oxide reductase [Deltaproteobacteria bacterium]
MPIALLWIPIACAGEPSRQATDPPAPTAAAHAAPPRSDPAAVFGQPAPPPGAGQAVAIFAGGCFWCMEAPFDRVDGVIATTSGYTGGPEVAPTYRQVSSHATGHAEAVRVLYDPGRVSYARLLDVFWHNIDPTQAEGQFCDHGHQYRTAVFTDDPAERALFEASKAAVEARLGTAVATELAPAAPFWPAEDYHQDYSARNPDHYHRYRAGCGRDRRLQELWGEAAVVGEGESWVVAAAP